MPNIPVEYGESLDLKQVQSVLGRKVDADWVAAQVAGGHLEAAQVENPDYDSEDPESPETIPSTTLVTRTSLAEFVVDRAPGGEHFVKGKR